MSTHVRHAFASFTAGVSPGGFRRGGIVAFLVFFVATGTFAVDADTWANPVRLRAVEVEGLRRTREQVVLDLIGLESGDLLTDETVRAAEEELIDSEIFADVTITPVRPENAPESVDLLITVREKWTLIPIPFFTTDGNTAGGGIILIESNLLGRNKQLITAAFGGSSGFSGFFAYADPSVFGSPWSGRVSAGTGRTDEVHLLPDGTEIRRYTMQRINAGGGIGYRFTRELRAGADIRVSTREISDFEGNLDATPPPEGTFLEPALSLGYDATRPRGVLRLGPEIEGAARIVSGGNENTDTGWEVSGNASLAVPFIRAQEGRIRLIVTGGTGQMAPADKRAISARDVFRSLPYQRTVAERWAGTAIFADVPLLRRSWGAFVLSHYWEGGTFDDSSHKQQFYGGPGGGFRIFLREIAIPAVGLDLAYNMFDPGIVFSFALGARM